jgi:hypothetical protein
MHSHLRFYGPSFGCTSTSLVPARCRLRGDDLEGMSKVEYYTKYLGQYKSMNDAVAAYIIDHVDWTPAAEFLAHNEIHEAAQS